MAVITADPDELARETISRGIPTRFRRYPSLFLSDPEDLTGRLGGIILLRILVVSKRFDGSVEASRPGAVSELFVGVG
jgi:hypothetical protein